MPTPLERVLARSTPKHCKTGTCERRRSERTFVSVLVKITKKVRKIAQDTTLSNTLTNARFLCAPPSKIQNGIYASAEAASEKISWEHVQSQRKVPFRTASGKMMLSRTWGLLAPPDIIIVKQGHASAEGASEKISREHVQIQRKVPLRTA